jgi:acetyl esterase/lipase
MIVAEMDPPLDLTVFQPLHSSIRSKLSQEYVAFHDAILQYIPRTENLPFDPIKSRSQISPFAKTGLEDVEIEKVEDRAVERWQVRIFTPLAQDRQDDKPKTPALLWFHGGGYVMGGLNSENSFLRFVCRHIGCVVLSINYRHAPENPFPAAINDSISAFQHFSSTLIPELNIDSTRVAIGGLSAGGQLAASTSLWVADCGKNVVKPCLQILICPVLDNTAKVEGRWKESQYAPWLTPGRMCWYRSKYLLSATDAANYLASPLLAPSELLRRSPPTFIAVAGCDLLAPEDMEFAKRLDEEGVKVEKLVYEGATHSVLVLAGLQMQGKMVVRDACMALGKAFGVALNINDIETKLGFKSSMV